MFPNFSSSFEPDLHMIPLFDSPEFTEPWTEENMKEWEEMLPNTVLQGGSSGVSDEEAERDYSSQFTLQEVPFGASRGCYPRPAVL